MTRREMERKAIWVARHYDARFGHEVEVRYDDEYLYQVAPEMNLFRRVRRFDSRQTDRGERRLHGLPH